MTRMERAWLASMPVQLSVSCLLSICMGACFATGVFTDAVESAARPAGSLDAVWPFAVGLFFILADVMMIPPAALLTTAADRAPTLRLTGYVSALGFALFASAAPAVRASVAPLVVLAVSMLSVPFGLLSFLVMEHVLAWMPARFGLAVGVVSAAGSVGTGIFATTFASLVTAFDVGAAICVSAILLTICTAVLSTAIRLPLTEPPPAGGEYGATVLSNDGITSSEADTGDQVRDQARDDGASLRSLMSSTPVWLYATTIGALCAALPMLSSVFRIGKAFAGADEGDNDKYLLRIMQVSSAVSTCFNLVAPAATDVLRTRRGPLRSGAANLTCFALVLQTFAFIFLCSSARAGNIRVWGVAAAVTQTTYQAALAFAALLARDAFGARYMALVYGAAGGPALAVGDGLSAAFMAGLEWMLVRRAGRHIAPADYLAFYFFGVLVSAAGAVSVGALVLGAHRWPVKLRRAAQFSADRSMCE